MLAPPLGAYLCVVLSNVGCRCQNIAFGLFVVSLFKAFLVKEYCLIMPIITLCVFFFGPLLLN